ncbi:hypothetical protein [Sandarakinorhabdus rubra]|uniref:hypothetical protein n=1 Tax=Sandarakinorhabdus rubra TaxID=2672568 RepID=UPI0013DA9C75|nr:hypothetical protein [Sandarakinorhabdus rubra]
MKFEFRAEGQETGSATSLGPSEHSLRQLEFDLPNKLLVQLAGAASVYLAAMYVAFRGGSGLGLAFVIFGVVLVGYYGLPIVLQRASGPRQHQPGGRQEWSVDTATGRLSGGALYAQVMTVPLVMVGWALIMAVMM